jgi:hypothetical protein
MFNSGLTSSVDLLEKYSALHLSNDLYESNCDSDKKNSFDMFSMFPIVRKIAARTIGMDLVSVTPMSEPNYNSNEELDKIKGEIKSINRDNKIDSVLLDKEYKEMDIKEHSDYKGEGLLYIDYVYGSKNNAISKKIKRKI